MTRLVDLDQLSADDLFHLAHLARERERTQAENRAAEKAEVMWKPALGFYRRQREEAK
jgi:hypothetical protein